MPISSTYFGQFFAHPQERNTVFYILCYNAPKLLPAGGLERVGTDCVFGVKDVAGRGGTDCVFGMKDVALSNILHT